MNAMAALQQQAMQHSQHQMAFMQMQQQNIPLPPGPAPPLPPGPAPTSSISSIPTPTTSISAAAANQPPLPPGPPPPASNQNEVPNYSQNNQQYNQVAPPTSFAQNQYQGFHPRDPHQMRGGRQQHQPNRGGRGNGNRGGGRMDGPRPLMPYDDWHENPNPNANRGGGRGGGFGDRGGFGRGGGRGGRGGDSGRGFGGNRGGPGGRRNQDEEMGDPNNPNNAPLGPRPTRPTFGGPQSSDQAPLLPDQCRSMNQSQQNFKYTVQPPPPPGMPPNIATTSQQNNFSQNTTTNTPALQSKISNPDIIKKPSIITKNPIKYPEDKVRDEMNHFYNEIQGPKNQESESNSSNNGGRWDVQPNNNKHKLIPYEDSDSEGDDDGNWKRKRR